MKYEFRIGDYAETKDGGRGYVIRSDLLCYQDIVTGYIISVKFGDEETLTYEFTANEAHRQFNRIGRYDFAEGTKTPAITSLTCADESAMLRKINELVGAVNELLNAAKKEQE